MAAPLVFRSTDSGAPVLSGQVGALIEVLSACLIVNKAFSATAGAAFVDRTAEARLQGGTVFTMFQTPGTTDEFYVGMSSKFDRIRFVLGTVSIGGTYVWEYWNGSAWTTFVPVVNTTVAFTMSGTVSWSSAALTGWAANAVNGTTQYWVRVRLTAANSQNPTVASLSVTGWSLAFTGTNLASYQQGGGNLFFLDVGDAAAGAGGAKEARTRGYETMTAVGAGAGPFPTVAQLAGGSVLRKSVTADATARIWLCWADDRTVYMFMLTGDAASVYHGWGYGDFYSKVVADSFRTILIGQVTENEGNGSSSRFGGLDSAIATGIGSGYAARAYTGVSGSLLVSKSGDQIKQSATYVTSFNGALQFPNGADGGLVLAVPSLYEPLGPTWRGWLRGLHIPMHPPAAFNDGDTVSGVGELAGRSFLAVKGLTGWQGQQSGIMGTAFLETSDTVDTN